MNSEFELIQQFKAFIEDNQLCTANDKILLAVSGGADSVVLAHLFQRLNYPLAIAHMNFQLRGEEANGDEQFVRQFASKLQLPLFVKVVDTKSYAQVNRLSTQVAARDLRYAFFEALCAEQGFSKVAVAHHADDQNETFFINLQRSSGLKGLAGIPLERDNIIRPLLFASRQQIETYAFDNKLSFRNDASNNSDAYLRNRIRHHLLPVAEEVVPGLLSALSVTMSHLREADELISYMVSEKKKSLFREMGEETRISVAALSGLHPLKTWLYFLLETFNFNPEVIQSVTKAIKRRESGKVFFSAKYKLIMDRAELIILPKQQMKIAKEVSIPMGCNGIEMPFKLDLKVVERTTVLDLKVNTDTALFDYDQLSFPMLLRPWRQGDRFFPFGMQGSKLVSDYLVDVKVSILDKEKIYVLVSGDQIIWIVGMRAGRKAAVIKETKKILRIKTC